MTSKNVDKFLKRCLGDRVLPPGLLNEIKASIKNHRIDLIDPNFGLGPKGKPDGSFYTFAHDPKAIQRFVQAASHIIFPLDSQRVIGQIFPHSCYLQLSLLRDSKGNALSLDRKLAGDYAPGLAEKLKKNSRAFEKIKGCLSKNQIVRVGVVITTLDYDGYVVGGHSIGIVIQPSEDDGSRALVTMLDPAAPAELNSNSDTIKSIGKYIGAEVDIFIPTFACKRSFQGQTELCSVWSLFLLLTHLINPPEWWAGIEKYYLDLPENETNKLIYQFSWWFQITFGDLRWAGVKGPITYRELIRVASLPRPIVIPKAEW